MNIEATASFKRCLRGFSDGRLEAILGVMRAAAQAYGQPHLHTGIGLRKIALFMECRDALENRLLFQQDGGSLVFYFYGTHDEVRRFVRNGR